MIKKPVHLNDNNSDTFVIKDENDLRNVFISIPVYWGIDDDGEIQIDTESMMEEFQRHVYGLETIVDKYNEDLK